MIDWTDKDISSLSRHISLIFKHIGFVKTGISANIESSDNEKVMLKYHYWYQTLIKSVSTNVLQRKCYFQPIKKLNLTRSKNVNYLDNDDKPQKATKLNWLRNVVYILSLINYRKEVNQLEGVYKPNFWENGKEMEEGEDSDKRDVGKSLFRCVLSNGIQLLRKVKTNGISL